MNKRLWILLFAILWVTWGCGSQQELAQPESMMDQPLFHIQNGFELLDRGEYEPAVVSFRRAVAIDPENAAALAGDAMAELLAYEDSTAARELSREARSKDDRNPYIYLVRAYLDIPGYMVPVVIDNRLPEVYERVHENLMQALEYGESDDRVQLWAARAYVRILDFNKAKDLLTEIASRDAYESQANNCLRRIHQVERLAPTTDLGKALALMSEVTRAEAAALISLELHPGRYLEEYDVRTPSDVLGHWAENSLLEMLTTGLFELDIEGHVNSDEPLTRQEYALACLRMMAGFANDPRLAARYMDSEVGYDDLAPDDPAYSAARTVVENGLLTAENGHFYPNGTVSGADVLEMVSWLRERYERSF